MSKPTKTCFEGEPSVDSAKGNKCSEDCLCKELNHKLTEFNQYLRFLQSEVKSYRCDKCDMKLYYHKNKKDDECFKLRKKEHEEYHNLEQAILNYFEIMY